MIKCKVMIIGVNGKIGSGKDLTGKIIQVLTSQPTALDGIENLTEEIIESKIWDVPNFEVKKFAGKLKDMVCLLIGCTRKQLEDNDFKNTELGEEWVRYSYADGHNDHYRNGEWTKSMHSVPCTKEKYEEQRIINWQTAYKFNHTPRTLLQLLGTECIRDIIHPNAWINALISEYYDLNLEKGQDMVSQGKTYTPNYPNWVITDMRFPNEFDAIKNRSGITIKIERRFENKTEDGYEVHYMLHPSEIALDKHNFDYTIHNNGSINDLVKSVKTVLRKIGR